MYFPYVGVSICLNTKGSLADYVKNRVHKICML